MLKNRKIVKSVVSVVLIAALSVPDAALSAVTNTNIISSTLAPPLMTKPSCDIVKKPDGSFEVITGHDVIDYWNNKLPLNASKDTWAFVDISFLIARALELQISEHTLKTLVKQHIRNRTGQEVEVLQGYDIEHIRSVKKDDRITSFILPYMRGDNRYEWIFSVDKVDHYDFAMPLSKGGEIRVLVEKVVAASDHVAKLNDEQYVAALREAAIREASADEILAIDGGPDLHGKFKLLAETEERAKTIEVKQRLGRAITVYCEKQAGEFTPEEKQAIEHLRILFDDLDDSTGDQNYRVFMEKSADVIAFLRSFENGTRIYYYMSQFRYKDMTETIHVDFPNLIMSCQGNIQLMDIVDDDEKEALRIDINNAMEDLRRSIKEAKRRIDSLFGPVTSAIALQKTEDSWEQHVLTNEEHDLINKAWRALWLKSALKYALDKDDEIYQDIERELRSLGKDLPINIHSPPNDIFYDTLYSLDENNILPPKDQFILFTHSGTYRDENKKPASFNLLIPRKYLILLRFLRKQYPAKYNLWLKHEIAHLKDRASAGADKSEGGITLDAPISELIKEITGRAFIMGAHEDKAGPEEEAEQKEGAEPEHEKDEDFIGRGNEIIRLMEETAPGSSKDINGIYRWFENNSDREHILFDLRSFLLSSIEVDRRYADMSASIDEVLKSGKGVCWDFVCLEHYILYLIKERGKIDIEDVRMLGFKSTHSADNHVTLLVKQKGAWCMLDNLGMCRLEGSNYEKARVEALDIFREGDLYVAVDIEPKIDFDGSTNELTIRYDPRSDADIINAGNVPVDTITTDLGEDDAAIEEEVEDAVDIPLLNPGDDEYVSPFVVERILEEAGDIFTREEEQLLFRAYYSDWTVAGDYRYLKDEIRKQIILRNQRFVYTCLKGEKIDITDDSLQDGYMGLVKAFDKFDWRRGLKFITYAKWWIINYTRRGFNTEISDIYVPKSVVHAASKLKRIIADLSKKIGRYPEISEIAWETGLKEEEIRKLLGAKSHSILSLDAPAGGEESKTPFHDIISAEMGVSIKENIAPLFACLDLRERVIVKMRYGIGTFNERRYTLEAISDLFGLTRERIRQIEKAALAKLREADEAGSWEKVSAEINDNREVCVVERLKIKPSDERFSELMMCTEDEVINLGLKKCIKVARLRIGRTLFAGREAVDFKLKQPLKVPALLNIDIDDVFERARILLEGVYITLDNKRFRVSISPEQINVFPNILLFPPSIILRKLSNKLKGVNSVDEAKVLMEDIGGVLSIANKLKGVNSVDEAKVLMEDIGGVLSTAKRKVPMGLIELRKKLYGAREEVKDTLTLKELTVLELTIKKLEEGKTDGWVSDELFKAGFSGRQGPLDVSSVANMRERAIAKLDFDKTGLEFLAEDLDVDASEITEEVTNALDRRYWEALKLRYGIGVYKAGSLAECVRRLKAIGVYPEDADMDPQSVEWLLAEAKKLLSKLKTGRQILADEAGIDVQSLTEDMIYTLDACSWDILKIVYGIGVQRIDTFDEAVKYLRDKGYKIKDVRAITQRKYIAFKKLKEGFTAKSRLAQEIGVYPEMITEEAINSIPEIAREVLRMRYGLGRHYVFKAEDIAKALSEKGFTYEDGNLFNRKMINTLRKQGMEYLETYLLGEDRDYINSLLKALGEKIRREKSLLTIAQENQIAASKAGGKKNKVIIKSGIEMLADDLGLEVSDVSEERFWSLPFYFGEVLRMYYGIGRAPAKSLQEIADELTARGIGDVRAEGYTSKSHISKIKRDSLAHMRKYANGLEYLADKAGLTVSELVQKISLLSMVEWESLKLKYGIGEQRKNSDEDILRTIAEREIHGRFGPIKSVSSLRHLRERAMKRLKGLLPASKYSMGMETAITETGYDMNTNEQDKVGLKDLSPEINPAGEKVNAETFADGIKIIEGKTTGAKPVIYLGTSWIKGYTPGENQYSALNPLVTAIRKFCEKRGIEFIICEDEALESDISGRITKEENRQFLVLSGEKTAEALSKNEKIKGNENVVLVGVNNRFLNADAYIPLMRMLSILVRLGAGVPVETNILEEREGYCIITPRAGPLGYEKFKPLYDIQKFA